MTNQEAIEIIKTAIAQVEWDYPMDYAAAFDMAVKALGNGWISVRDRLPPANDLVIVSINDDRGDNDYRYTDTGWYLTEGKCWIVDNEATINVEAWMPFPKPYKPTKEADKCDAPTT